MGAEWVLLPIPLGGGAPDSARPPQRTAMTSLEKLFRCTKCGLEFQTGMKYPKSWQCKNCRKAVAAIWREKNRDKCRAYARDWMRRNPIHSHKHKLANRYGITLQEYDSMLEAQNGVCAICGKDETRTDHRTGKPQKLSVDHNHSSGKNRGLLCDACNKVIGQFAEDSRRFRKAAEYLDKYEAANA